jgi:hypothetical protein
MQRLEQAHQDPHDEVGPGSSGHDLMRHCMRQCLSGDSIGPRMMRHGSMRGPFAMPRPIIRSAMRSPPMTATSIRTTQNYGRLPSGLMKTASRSPTSPRLSTAIPTIGPIPRKGHRRLRRHHRRPIRHPGRTLLANEPLASSLKTTRALQPLARRPHQCDRTGFVEIRRRSDRAARPRRVAIVRPDDGRLDSPQDLQG